MKNFLKVPFSKVFKFLLERRENLPLSGQYTYTYPHIPSKADLRGCFKSGGYCKKAHKAYAEICR